MKDIVKLKKELNKLAVKNINNLISTEIVKKSQILDKLIVKEQRSKLSQIMYKSVQNNHGNNDY
ncbi:aspartyl-phosphate phosphatase Spo0E family protein [Caldisalinibacter kiritimatiensis]|uniref:Uncharacterized protein n=1 Tax=Caldisalinibacter kiritimatiensis TaxID=1304284 RepID=R1CS13_9FIRM|nr:aspartyl-phosphate phosphatase Spo0E family protein [Caldisalinibacter kiritimatiensis]EOD01446.1 hypothetical protein L21TH_0493 [Caldisalinibacter kiritimatiensis]